MWTRSFNDIPQTSCFFLCKIVSGFKKTEPILRSRGLEDHIEGSDHDADTIEEREPSNVDHIKA